MESDSQRQAVQNGAEQLNHIDSEILKELKHLNLSQYKFVVGGGAIGQGGYADIFKGAFTHPDHGLVTVAMKHLHFNTKEDIKTLFEKEIYMWQKLKHKNILLLLGYAFDDRTRYPILISEWMENGSAWEFVQSNPDFNVMNLVTGVAHGLAYLHSQGIVHSDVKLDNVLVTKSRDAVICDFRFTRMMVTTRTLMQLGGDTKGTFPYMAYEMILHPDKYTTPSTATDVWAFGMTVYELLARQRPYNLLMPLQAAMAIAKLDLPRLPEADPPLTASESGQVLWDICQRCWEPSPHKRASMASIIKLLPLHDVLAEIGQEPLMTDEALLDRPSPPEQDGVERLSNVDFAILEELRHLDLSQYKFEVQRMSIGGGAYADVFKGTLTHPNRGRVTVALKHLHFNTKEDLKTLFEKEIYIWQKLKHKNILLLLGYAFDDRTGYPVLVSEWMENGSAWKFVQSHPDCNVMHLVTGIADGLAYLHSRGIVHSDIKLDNVLVTDSQDAVICSFGLSGMVNTSRSFTKLNSVPNGMLSYMAHEVVVDNETYNKNSTATDVWAFGMTVYELLARQRPFHDLQYLQMVLAIAKLDLPKLPESDPPVTASELGQVLWNVCQRCWEPSPERRVRMASIIEDLQLHDVTPEARQESLIIKSDVASFLISYSVSDYGIFWRDRHSFS